MFLLKMVFDNPLEQAIASSTNAIETKIDDIKNSGKNRSEHSARTEFEKTHTIALENRERIRQKYAGITNPK